MRNSSTCLVRENIIRLYATTNTILPTKAMKNPQTKILPILALVISLSCFSSNISHVLSLASLSSISWSCALIVGIFIMIYLLLKAVLTIVLYASKSILVCSNSFSILALIWSSDFLSSSTICFLVPASASSSIIHFISLASWIRSLIAFTFSSIECLTLWCSERRALVCIGTIWQYKIILLHYHRFWQHHEQLLLFP